MKELNNAFNRIHFVFHQCQVYRVHIRLLSKKPWELIAHGGAISHLFFCVRPLKFGNCNRIQCQLLRKLFPTPAPLEIVVG